MNLVPFQRTTQLRASYDCADAEAARRVGTLFVALVEIHDQRVELLTLGPVFTGHVVTKTSPVTPQERHVFVISQENETLAMFTGLGCSRVGT
jgi:hypothetical protein